MKSVQENDFDAIYNDTYPDVLKYVVLHCRYYSDIQDIIQNIYINFYIRYQKYGRLHFLNVRKYIYRIMRDELSKYYKSTAIESQNFSMDEENATGLVDEFFLMEDNICNECQREEIWNIIRNKDVLTFKIFTLHFLYDYKIKKIAQQLNITESSVKNKLYRTIHELKRTFDPEDF